MRRKVKKSLTLFMASVMVVSLLCSRELAVFAEDAGTVGQTVLETEESFTEELVTEESVTEPPASSEEIWDDQTPPLWKTMRQCRTTPMKQCCRRQMCPRHLWRRNGRSRA